MSSHHKSETGEAGRQRRTRQVAFKVLKYCLAAVAVYFAGAQVAGHWTEMASYEWQLNFGWLALSVIGHILTFVLFSKVWCILISGFGYQVPLKYGFKIGYIANLGRYIPGKIWPVFGMTYLAKQIGIREEISVTSWIIALLFTLPAAFLAGACAVILYPDLLSGELESFYGTTGWIFAAVTFGISLTLVVAPNQFLALFNLGLKLFKRKPLGFRLSVSTAASVYFGYFICWLCYGLSFWLFIKAIVAEPDIPAMAAAGSFVLAYQIGYLALFAPGGLGVRELALITLLTPFLGPLAPGIAVAARVWNIVCELTAAIIAWNIKFSDRK